MFSFSLSKCPAILRVVFRKVFDMIQVPRIAINDEPPWTPTRSPSPYNRDSLYSKRGLAICGIVTMIVTIIIGISVGNIIKMIRTSNGKIKMAFLSNIG